ncbi:CLUMA_CG013679, isoform A [Clunio marinus]|uniref:RNA helicase n=1 Tax=Clunio marinus TaxID=568069 RepID=A0A1J1ILH0_9DIPT|nr:CLUMA_CG013679, isoform A [Clunio marinus]
MYRRTGIIQTFLRRQSTNAATLPANKKSLIPLITCKNTEFNLMYDVDNKKTNLPHVSKIVLASKGWQHYKAKGDHFIIHPIKDIIETNLKDSTDFENLNLNETLLKNLREKHDIRKATKLQQEAIAEIRNKNNVLIAAETGCGKTHAYLLPIIEQIIEQKSNEKESRQFNTPLVLILTPGRELAEQIGKFAKELSTGLNLNVKIIIGGNTKQKMFNPSFEDIDILVGSIGAISKLTTTGIVRMNKVKHVVLDEADTLLEDSFNEKLVYFLRRFSFHIDTQMILASATMPTNTDDVFRDVLDTDNMKKVVSSDLHKILPYVTQKFMRMNKSDRPENLLRIIKSEVLKKRPVIVFSNKSNTCDYVSLFLNSNGIETFNLNGDMLMKIRTGRFEQFQNGEINVLSTTDCIGRGLNTVRARHIINFDFPLYMSDYIHRCGRIGRFGSSVNCRITNFISSLRELDLVRKIEMSARTNTELENVNANIRQIINSKIEREISKLERMSLKELKESKN